MLKFIFLWIIITPIFIFGQKNKNNQNAKSKIEQYITTCKASKDLVKIEIFKKDYEEIFLFYPDINPINPKIKPSLSSGFSTKRLHPIENNIKAHFGVDIVAKKNTPIYATASGTVIKSKFFNGKAGHSIEIGHKYGFKTKYFHLNLFIVKKGERVLKGQIIGYLGNSGASTGYHLHYEIIKNGKNIDPIDFLNIKP